MPGGLWHSQEPVVGYQERQGHSRARTHREGVNAGAFRGPGHRGCSKPDSCLSDEERAARQKAKEMLEENQRLQQEGLEDCQDWDDACWMGSGGRGKRNITEQFTDDEKLALKQKKEGEKVTNPKALKSAEKKKRTNEKALGQRNQQKRQSQYGAGDRQQGDEESGVQYQAPDSSGARAVAGTAATIGIIIVCVFICIFNPAIA